MTQINLNTTKNLLAFSAGVDSSALFFILLENNIPFDIAIVNYNVRAQSKNEVEYAKSLSLKYGKKYFIKEVKLDITSNFEKTARDIRYSFFDEIINENSYETLITAHQLNDKFEWFLMQISKGAGLIELMGLEEFSTKNNYQIYRPLLNTSREKILNYLQQNNIKYFEDVTNQDTDFKRNYFRKEFSNKFIKEFEDGVIKSFEYLKNDINSLNIDLKPIIEIQEFELFKNLGDENLNIKLIDKSLKRRGILLTKAQRDEILNKKELTISHKINISISNEYIFISPKSKVIMDKKFKEICRILKIPKNIRSYLFEKNINPKNLSL